MSKSIDFDVQIQISESNLKDMKEKSLQWLEGHKKELERQIKHIDPALKELVSMRGARLKRLAPVDRPVPDKKVKIDKEAEEWAVHSKWVVGGGSHMNS